MNFYFELDATERARAEMLVEDVDVDYVDDEDYDDQEDDEDDYPAQWEFI